MRSLPVRFSTRVTRLLSNACVSSSPSSLEITGPPINPRGIPAVTGTTDGLPAPPNCRITCPTNRPSSSATSAPATPGGKLPKAVEIWQRTSIVAPSVVFSLTTRLLRLSLARSGSMTSTVSGVSNATRLTSRSSGRNEYTARGESLLPSGGGTSRLSIIVTCASLGWLTSTTVSRGTAWPGKVFCESM